MMASPMRLKSALHDQKVRKYLADVRTKEGDNALALGGGRQADQNCRGI
jgi:hypothetical protein